MKQIHPRQDALSYKIHQTEARPDHFWKKTWARRTLTVHQCRTPSTQHTIKSRNSNTKECHNILRYDDCNWLKHDEWLHLCVRYVWTPNHFPWNMLRNKDLEWSRWNNSYHIFASTMKSSMWSTLTRLEDTTPTEICNNIRWSSSTLRRCLENGMI